MKIPTLNKINSNDALAIVDIKDLLKAGLSYDEDYEISEDFWYCHNLKISNPFSLHISRSKGWYGNLEFIFSLHHETDSSNSNIHIEQEINLSQNEEHRDLFVCPFLGYDELTTKLYLRENYPLFGSKKALNID